MGLKDNLVRHYTFDSSDIIVSNAYTFAIDRSDNHKNASAYNVTLTSVSPAPRYSTGTSFSNSTSYISATNIPTSTTYTFSWWGKFTNVSDKMMWGFNNGNRLNLCMSNGYFYWNTGDGNKNPFGTISSSLYADNKWHHFAVTSDGTVSKLYIDGEFKANATINRSITGTTLIFNGWGTSGTRYNFNGSLSDFRLYNTCITEDEIKYLSKEPLKFRKTGVISSPGEFVEGNAKSLGSTGTVTMTDFIEY